MDRLTRAAQLGAQTPEALHSVVSEIGAAKLGKRLIVEMGTFSLDTKLSAAKLLAAAGHDMLDCLTETAGTWREKCASVGRRSGSAS